MPEYWYMLPVALCISTLALTSGVAGATFFTPLFLLWLGLPLRVAIAASLITATFGFASGLAGYYRRRLIDFRIGVRLLAASIPAAMLGVWLATRVDPSLLRALLGLGLLTIAVSFLRPERGTPEKAAGISAWEGGAFAGVGGLSLGMISAGLGELNAYYLIRRRGMPTDTAVATSVLVVAVLVIYPLLAG